MEVQCWRLCVASVKCSNWSRRQLLLVCCELKEVLLDGRNNCFDLGGSDELVGLRWKWWMDVDGGAVSSDGSKCRVWIHCGVEGRG